MEDLHGRPPGKDVGAVPILVAADIKTSVEFPCRAVLADVDRSPNLDEGPERNATGTGDNIVTAADIGTGSRNAGCLVRLRRDRVVTRHEGMDPPELERPCRVGTDQRANQCQYGEGDGRLLIPA